MAKTPVKECRPGGKFNSLRDEGAGFGQSTNKIVIFDREGQAFPSD